MARAPSRGRLFFATANALSAVLLAAGVFAALPARFWPVDLGAAIVSGLLGAAGIALLVRSRHAPTIARLASFVVLVLGLALTAALVATSSWLATVYGPVGQGGAAAFAVLLALVLPYVVVLPAAELVWLGPRRRRP